MAPAVGSLGETKASAEGWAVAIETILLILGNILKNPGAAHFYQINIANPIFHRR